MGKDIKDRGRKDSLSSSSDVDSLSRSNSLSSSEERNKKDDGKNRKRSSSDSVSSDDRNKSKKERRDKDSKDSKKDKKKDDKKKKSKKKISKEDKKDKKKKSKSGKDKKSKKEKKEKKSKKSSKKETKLPVKKSTNKFGKYGIINKEHIYEKRDEFQQWLSDVKQLNIEALGQNEEKRLFEDFIEDYNTASMPEKKYYDLALWETYTNAKSMGKNIKINDDTPLDDEAQMKRERERQKQQQENVATSAIVNQLFQGNIASEILETQAKTALMQQKYKIGDIEKALELQKELQPEKKKPGQQ